MRSICIISLLFACAFTYAQKSPPKEKDKKEPFICMMPIESEAIPSKDWNGFLERATTRIVDSIINSDNIGQGCYTVIFKYTIDETGILKDFTVVKDEHEVGWLLVKKLQHYPGKWTPAFSNGKNVRSHKQQSVRFTVEDDPPAGELPYPAVSIRKMDIPVDVPAPDCCADIVKVEQRIFESDGNSGRGKPIEHTYIPLAHGGVETIAITDMNKWRNYLQYALDSAIGNYNKLPPGEYTATVNMIIDKDGSLLNATIATDPGYDIARHLKSIIEKYPVDRTPATHNGRPVKYFCSQTVVCKIGVEKDVNCDHSAGKRSSL